MGEKNPLRPPEDSERQDRRSVETHVEAKQSPEREKEGEKVAKELVSENLEEELKWIKERFKSGCGKIESAYNEKNFDAITGRSRFAEGLLLRALKLPLVGIMKRWEADISEMSRKGWDKKKMMKLRDQYAHEGNGEIAKAVGVVEAYVRKMREESENRGTPEVLAEMTRSLSKNAEVYADLLAKGGNKDLVDALGAVFGMQIEGKSSAESLREAVKTIKNRLEKEFPDGGLMAVLWMVMSFFDKNKRLETANYFKQKHPDKIEKFLEAGNLYGVFDADEMEQILGKKYNAEKKTELVLKWQMQNDFSKEGKTMLESSYGSENPVNTMLSGKNLGLFAIQLAAGATIGANLLVTAFTTIKGKGIAGGILALPEAVLKTIQNKNVIGSAVALGGVHLAKSPKTLGEILMPKEERDNLKRAQGRKALRMAKKGNPLWDKWNEMFISDNFSGGKVFADFVRYQKSKAEDENIEKAELAMADFLEYIEEQSKSKNPMQKNFDYTDLKKKTESALAGADDSQVLTLAKAFDYLEIGGATGKANYEKHLKEIEKA